MQSHELALKDYILGMKLNDIAQKYNVSINTVKSWRKRHGWSRDKKIKKVAPIAPQKNDEGCTPKKEALHEEELNEKEQIFCYHYVRTWNATQAALLAEYGNTKYSAGVLGCRLLQRPRVKAEIDRLKCLFRQELHIDIQDFLTFCMKIVGADIGDYLTFGQKEVPVIGMVGPVVDKETGEPVTEIVNTVELNESDKLDTSVISEVKQGKDGVSVKLADKKWAWEQLIKYFDWLPDKYQRSIEDRKLELEERRVKAAEAKVGDAGEEDGKEEADSYLEALKEKVPEVWSDGT